MKLAGFLCLLALPALAQYSVHQEGDVVRLEDGATQTVVSVMPSRGDNAFQMTVKGKNVLQFPFNSPAEFKTRGNLNGMPFLEPWANRLDGDFFYANGKKYEFNMGLGNVRGAIPMHGMLTTASQWEIVEAKADQDAAWITCKLDFYRYPDWMAQWPFAHTIELTHKLHNGVLQVTVKLTNLSTAPMPVSVGFHPYFQVNDAQRDDWTFHIAARTHWILNQFIPTGETEPIEKFLPGQPESSSLKGVRLDDLFNDLIRDPDGRATMWLQGKSEKVEVSFGPNFKAAVVYFPAGPNQNFICLEPMAAITDALNLAQKGVYKDLQSIAPGGTWQDSFWVKPSGF
ncbi:MAG TPA: aldose 1-epimerase [Bryobacteraceae bacterium]|nr:aldose 1-epimerase [Bryobacteraceae bacterium]